MKQTLLGKFIWESDKEAPHFLTNEEQLLENIDISNKPDVPEQEYLQITLDDHTLVSWRHDPRMPLADQMSNRVIALARVYKPGKTLSENQKQRHINMAKSVQDEWNFIGRGKVTYEVHPHFFESDSSFSLRGFDWRSLRRHLREVDSNVNYTHYHIIGGFESGICGRAWIGGNEAWTSERTSCGSSTVKHEHGHNERFHHAGTEGLNMVNVMYLWDQVDHDQDIMRRN